MESAGCSPALSHWAFAWPRRSNYAGQASPANRIGASTIHPHPMQRSRIRTACALLLTIGFGLATRSSSIPWPDFVSQNFGDALWTVAVYLSLALALPRASALKLAALSLCLSFAVEFSQRLQFPWLVELRGTLPGSLLLGSGFVWWDLARYAAGALAAFALETVFRPLVSKSAAQG